jgi:hypothetical protein
MGFGRTQKDKGNVETIKEILKKIKINSKK